MAVCISAAMERGSLSKFSSYLGLNLRSPYSCYISSYTSIAHSCLFAGCSGSARCDTTSAACVTAATIWNIECCARSPDTRADPRISIPYSCYSNCCSNCYLFTFKLPSCRLQWFSQVRYNIGGMDFSCNDMEHGVLRGNAASPASLGVLLGKPSWAKPTFKQKDPRARLVSFEASTITCM